MRTFHYAVIVCDTLIKDGQRTIPLMMAGHALIENGIELEVPDKLGVVIKLMTEQHWALHTIFRKYSDSGALVTVWERPAD